MIFLIVKIFVYLAMAGAIGGVAGWLLRNLQAQKSEEAAARGMNDAKSKLPHLESLLRGRDDQLKKAQIELDAAKDQLKERGGDIRAHEQTMREQEREIQRLRQTAQATASTTMMGSEYTAADAAEGIHDDGNDLIAELSQEISRLKLELEVAQSNNPSSVADPADPADPAERGTAADESLMQVEFDALRVQLESVQLELTRAQEDLRSEQDRVRDFERERGLQNESIKVLHQQLEMARSKRMATG